MFLLYPVTDTNIAHYMDGYSKIILTYYFPPQVLLSLVKLMFASQKELLGVQASCLEAPGPSSARPGPGLPPPGPDRDPDEDDHFASHGAVD